MERYTLQERIEIIKIHSKNGENLAETAIKKLVGKFELLGQVSDVRKKPVHVAQGHRDDNVAAVAETVEENPGLPIHRRSLELGIPQTSFHRILHK